MNNLEFTLVKVLRKSGQRLARFRSGNGFDHARLMTIAREEFDLPLSAETHFFFAKELWLPLSLRDHAGVRFSIDGTGNLMAETKRFRAFIQTEEELFILNEVLVEGVYNFDHKAPVVVLDIGMNVGLSALSFASMENVQAIVGYEPFVPTYKQAQRNFDLNVELARKITPHNRGLAAEKKTLTLDYCYDWKGMVGINGVPEHRRQNQTISREEIVLEDVCSAVDSLVADYPESEIVAKIDCEGAEYELIDALHLQDRLRRLKILMIEWHNNGPAELAQALGASDFSTFSFTTSKTTGMLYAVRN